MTNKSSGLIRSSQHRQILHWLLDESSTVSDISKGLGIRLPHASASMKQMRSAGLITRDTGSLRGALHRITSNGLQRFNKDCFIRAKRTISWPPPSKNHLMVIERSENLILICYAPIPEKTLFSIPSMRVYSLRKSNNTSSGNEGGLSLMFPGLLYSIRNQSGGILMRRLFLHLRHRLLPIPLKPMWTHP